MGGKISGLALKKIYLEQVKFKVKNIFTFFTFILNDAKVTL